ncbi:hypothetical protein M758_4G045200 [Ceratodon purpureus]|uniref:Uncharacterized protein n=1 Tax=Ceratodon purpureus TaxID=3225 RepID=A0A8T0I8J8_CERPU|nr:hypothetical protein KC19_4G048200 [Ceratodon purpureus]KAG0618190.1 hypothetical protein M758_4G045200 [Ceratodon purpureus]
MCSLKSAVQARSVIALVKVTYDLACQIRLRGVDGACRDIVSTDWWNEKENQGDEFHFWAATAESPRSICTLQTFVEFYKLV